MLQGKSVKVYWKVDCKFCEMAKNLLLANRIEYTPIQLVEKLDEMTGDRETMSLDYFKMTNSGIKTVPAIFINEIFIGGYTELKELIQLEKDKQPNE